MQNQKIIIICISIFAVICISLFIYFKSIKKKEGFQSSSNPITIDGIVSSIVALQLVPSEPAPTQTIPPPVVQEYANFKIVGSLVAMTQTGSLMQALFSSNQYAGTSYLSNNSSNSISLEGATTTTLGTSGKIMLNASKNYKVTIYYTRQISSMTNNTEIDLFVHDKNGATLASNTTFVNPTSSKFVALNVIGYVSNVDSIIPKIRHRNGTISQAAYLDSYMNIFIETV